MALYQVKIGPKAYRVEITDHEIMVDGECHPVSLTALNGGGLYLLRHGNQNRELHVRMRGQKSYEMTSDGRRIVTQIEGRSGQPCHDQKDHKAGDLVAPMPGMIIRIAAKTGQQVSAGDLLVTMESMKMQMELRAPISGKVTDLPIQSHALVEKGAILARLAQV